jgi:hypothetical protein
MIVIEEVFQSVKSRKYLLHENSLYEICETIYKLSLLKLIYLDIVTLIVALSKEIKTG